MVTWASPPLLWFLAGLVLFLLELASPGVLFVFFAAGAWIVALCLWIGIFDSFNVSLAVFIIASVGSLLLLRKRLKLVFRGTSESTSDPEAALDEFAGRNATVVEDIDRQKNTGAVDFRGARWRARADQNIAAGSTVQIVTRENLTLVVKPLQEN